MNDCNGTTPRVSVAQIGARMHYAVPILLHRAGMLEALYTDLCAEAGWVRAIERCLPRPFLPQAARRLIGRRVSDVPRERIVCFSSFGVARFLGRSRANTPAKMLHHLVNANASFGRHIASRGLGQSEVIYTFNGAALEILQYARARGIRTILEQVSAPVVFDERLLAQERQLWPGWEDCGALPCDWQPMAERERREWELADTIICGSQYVVDAMLAVHGPVHKCKVVPYGVQSDGLSEPRQLRGCTLRVVCVATAQLRKGVQYLLETASLLKRRPIELRLIGPMRVSRQAVALLKKSIAVVGQVPRAQMHREYQRADVLILPSISEGSATVCYEALAMGLPVITTPNSGSVIRNGVDGFIVPIRDAHSLADRIAQLAGDRDLLERMSANAISSSKNYTWDRYSQRLIDAIQPTTALAA